MMTIMMVILMIMLTMAKCEVVLVCDGSDGGRYHPPPPTNHPP